MQTERLYFRQYEKKDRQHLINLMTNEKVMKYVDKGVLTLETAISIWKKLLYEFYPNGKTTIYAVFAKDDFGYVGNASIRPRPEKKEEWEIGYILTEKYWGKGLATEIAQKLVEFGFNELKLEKIFATVDDDNLASINVLKKVGMQLERYEYDEIGRFSVYSIALQEFKNHSPWN